MYHYYCYFTPQSTRYLNTLKLDTLSHISIIYLFHPSILHIFYHCKSSRSYLCSDPDLRSMINLRTPPHLYINIEITFNLQSTFPFYRKILYLFTPTLHLNLMNSPLYSIIHSFIYLIKSLFPIRILPFLMSQLNL